MCLGLTLNENVVDAFFLLFVQVAYVFDNEFTVVFAIFMSIWGKVFLLAPNEQTRIIEFVADSKLGSLIQPTSCLFY